MTEPIWDDERLDAAFREKFDRPAPPDLQKVVQARLAGTIPARFGAIRRSGPGWTLAAAAVVAVLIGTITVGLGGFGRTAGLASPSASGAGTTPGPSATPTEQALPGSVFGLPIIHVPDAIAIRDAGVDDREFAVQGWFTPAPLISCGGDATKVFVSPIQLRCPDQLMWLTEDAGSYVHVTGNRLDTETPQFTAALNPDLDGLDSTWWPDLPVPGQDGGSTPLDVVFVGHFDDRRAALCPRIEIDACMDRFVVDSVAIVHGVPTTIAPMYQNSTKAASSAADIEAIVASEAPDSPILSMTVVDGAAGLAEVEPSLGTGLQGLIDQPTVWVVRVLESEHLSTYIVVDGSDAIYEMNAEGVPILVGGTPPTAQSTASAGPWPPADALVLELPGLDIGKPPVRVAIVDKSGRLVSAMEQDPATVTPEGRFGAFPEPGKPGRVNLAWVGGVCDSQITITIGSDLRSITFDMGPQPDCDSMGVAHELVLYFTDTVDVPAIQVGEATAEASPPPPQGPENVVDCGPLAPDTCQAKAHEIVGADPGKPILTITFTDECGSYTATYVDGDGVSAIIDCIPGASPG